MCLIIERQPNFEIPFDKFESAVLNNPHGYGLSYPDQDGKLITLRSAEKPNVDSLYRLVNEELIDQKLMVHLRYTTVGKTILRNSHPFPVLERGEDGVDLRMAHNGTLGKYRPTDKANSESDTRVFVREFVRPLFKRLSRGMDAKEILQDSFTKKILEDQLTGASVLTFLDGDGNSLICNAFGNGGKQEADWYYSNVYSFNPKHRVKEPAPIVANTGVASKKKGTTGVAFKDSNVPKFTEKFGLKSIKDTFNLSDETISEIASDPEVSELLIKELLFELQRSTVNNEKKFFSCVN